MVLSKPGEPRGPIRQNGDSTGTHKTKGGYITILDASDFSSFADALKVNTAVTGIYLIGSRVGDRGATALAEALDYYTRLKLI